MYSDLLKVVSFDNGEEGELPEGFSRGHRYIPGYEDRNTTVKCCSHEEASPKADLRKDGFAFREPMVNQGAKLPI